MYDPTFASETAALGEALLTGAVLGVYYDVFRIIRRIIRCGYATIVGQDIFFWTTSAIFVFFTCIRLNNGVLRVIFVAAALGGWGLYMATLGSLVMLAADFLVKLFRRAAAGIHKTVFVPVKNSAKKWYSQRKSKKYEEI